MSHDIDKVNADAAVINSSAFVETPEFNYHINYSADLTGEMNPYKVCAEVSIINRMGDQIEDFNLFYCDLPILKDIIETLDKLYNKKDIYNNE